MSELRGQSVLRCTAEGRFVVALEHDDARVSCYSGETGELIWRHPLLHAAQELVFLDETHCAFNSGLREVSVLRLEDGERIQRWTTDVEVRSLCALPGTDHLLIAFSGRAAIERRHWLSGEPAWRLPVQHGNVSALCQDGASTLARDAQGVVRWTSGAAERLMRWPAETLNASRHLRAALSTRWTVALLNVGGAWHTWAYPLTGPSTGQGSRLELGDGERFEALALANDHLLAGSSETLLCFDLAQRSVAWRRPYSNARSAVACVIENADEPVFLLAGRGGQLVRVGRSPGLTPLGATSEPAAFVAHDPASQRVALVTGTGQVLAGEPNALERWGKLSQAQALTWHHGRLVGLDETGLTVWESGVARETLELHTVNQLGTSLGSTTGGHLLVGTAFGSIHVFEPR